MNEQALELRMEGSVSRVLFARRGEELVAIVDDGRIGPVGEARAGQLKENESLVGLLGAMPVATLGWSASTRDMTQVPLGVPSRGYTMGAARPGERWEFRFAFADPAEAGRANEAAGPFLKEAEAFLGVSLHPQVHENGDTLAVSFDLSELFTLEAAKMQALQKKLEEFAAGRRVPGG
jgi:hypothetical protein